MSRFWKCDVQLEHFEIALALDLHLYGIITDLDVLAQHIQQVLLQLREIRRLFAAAGWATTSCSRSLAVCAELFLSDRNTSSQPMVYLPISRSKKPFLA